MKDYEVFEEFFSLNYILIKRMSAYSGLSFEDMKQESAIAFFETKQIIKLFTSDKKGMAMSLFSKNLRRSLADFNNTGYVDRNSSYEREKMALEKIYESFEEYVSPEGSMLMSLELERLKGEYGDEISDIMEYYDLGTDLYSMKYKLKKSTARSNISRKLKKISLLEKNKKGE
ncbi:MAG: hypothetical protein ACRC5T_10405 [Cetobacterium sp.]